MTGRPLSGVRIGDAAAVARASGLAGFVCVGAGGGGTKRAGVGPDAWGCGGGSVLRAGNTAGGATHAWAVGSGGAGGSAVRGSFVLDADGRVTWSVRNAIADARDIDQHLGAVQRQPLHREA